MKGKYFILIFLILFLLFFCSQKTLAQSIESNQQNQNININEASFHDHDVVINELMWMGSLSSDGKSNSYDEWIELKNETPNPIDISSWQITNLVGTSNVETLMLTIPIGQFISANGYYLISKYDKDNSNSALNISSNLSGVDVVLRNSNLQIKIYKGNWNDSTNLIDVAGDGIGNPFAGLSATGLKKSMSRKATLGDGTNPESWYTDITSNSTLFWDIENGNYGTPGAENSPLPLPEEDFTGKIIFTRIMPNPISGNDNDKWVEIKNISDKSIDLSGWKIKDKAGSSRILSETLNQSTALKILAATFLNKSSPEELYLLDKNQKIINQMSYINPPEGIEYYLDTDGIWKWNLPPVKDYKGQIIFVEVLANPAGLDSKNEYVKIKNISTGTIDLTDWKIKDASNTNCKTLSTNIKPGEIIKVSELSCINNEVESLRIIDQNQNEISKVSYNHKIAEDEIYVYENGKWKWVLPKFDPDKLLKDHKRYQINQIRKLPLETKVVVEGIVIAKTGNFSDYYFYIQDETGGIKVYSKDKVKVETNDVVLIFGWVWKTYNQIILKFNKSDLIKIGRKDHYVKLSDTSKTIPNQNNLVKIKGAISKEGSKYYINDEFGKIRVFFTLKVKIKKPKDFKYSICEITGILDFYKDQFRLMVRNVEDIYVLKILKPAKKSSKTLVQKVLGVQTVYAQEKINIVLGKDYRGNSPPDIFIKSSNSDFDSNLHILAIVLIFASFFGIINLGLFGKNIK